MIPTDPLFVNQWHLQNTGQTGGTPGADIDVVSVWDDYTGAGIRVLVNDSGVQYQHPDIAGGYDTAVDRSVVAPLNDAFPFDGEGHGTFVAGLIGERANNDEGGVGVAFGATLTAYRLDFSGDRDIDQVVLDVAAALQYGANFDVSNNSYRVGSELGMFDSVFNPAAQPMLDALLFAAENGRGGLGTVNVFAAGNGFDSGSDTNLFGLQSSINAIAVAALDDNGTYADTRDAAGFSTAGASILISAPGTEVVSTDIPGAPGFSDGAYATGSGTSFASPVVAGVAALMLEANPDLGFRDVQEILAYSARFNDPLEPAWDANGTANWNGGGLHFNVNYGFGLVDAHAAVRLAETWPYQQTAANRLIPTADVVQPGAIPTAGRSFTFNVADDLELDQVRVQLDYRFSWLSEVDISLVSPAGTFSSLLFAPGSTLPVFQQLGPFDGLMQLTSTHFWGERSVGAWTLFIGDAGLDTIDDSGFLNDALLVLVGSPSSANDLYVYTDEYAAFGDAFPERQTLIDAGGLDILNAAAVTSAIDLNLTAGIAGSIAGVPWSAAPGTVIETAIGGDGNDSIAGNAANNLLNGGRGDDRLTGGAGNDSLDGGPGNDLAVFSGSQGSYVVLGLGGGAFQVGGPDGNDTLAGIEQAQFGAAAPIALSSLVPASSLTLAIAPAIAIEGNGGSHVLTFAVTLPVAAPTTITVTAATAGGTAGAGSDFLAATQTVTIPTGQSAASFAVTVFGDSLVEADETFTVTLSNPSGGAVISPISGAATGTIVNDDRAALIAINGFVQTGGAGDDFLAGGPLNDSINGAGGGNTLFGNDGDDSLVGGSGGDFVVGGTFFESGSDVIDVGGGTNFAFGGGGNDQLRGGAGNDLLAGELGDDLIIGGDGDNALYGGDGDDTIEGGAGGDIVFGQFGDDIIVTGGGFDLIIEEPAAGGGREAIDAGDGGSQIFAGGDDDTVVAGAGNDFILGEGGDDSIHSGAGNDALIAGPGNDTLDGGPGNDVLIAEGGDDFLIGGGGGDSFRYPAGIAVGADRILGFAPADDTVELSAGFGLTAAQARAQLAQSGADVLLSLGAAGSITFLAVQVADFTAADFAIIG